MYPIKIKEYKPKSEIKQTRKGRLVRNLIAIHKHFRGNNYNNPTSPWNNGGDLSVKDNCIIMAKKDKTLNGKPATQKNVTLENDFFGKIEKAGKLDFMSFSSYVRSLIVNDLQQTA